MPGPPYKTAITIVLKLYQKLAQTYTLVLVNNDRSQKLAQTYTLAILLVLIGQAGEAKKEQNLRNLLFEHYLASQPHNLFRYALCLNVHLNVVV